MVILQNESMISYKPLWETMKKRNITKYSLGLSNGTIDRLRNNDHISTYTIEKLCIILDCTPNDILIIINDK